MRALLFLGPLGQGPHPASTLFANRQHQQNIFARAWGDPERATFGGGSFVHRAHPPVIEETVHLKAHRTWETPQTNELELVERGIELSTREVISAGTPFRSCWDV